MSPRHAGTAKLDKCVLQAFGRFWVNSPSAGLKPNPERVGEWGVSKTTACDEFLAL